MTRSASATPLHNPPPSDDWPHTKRLLPWLIAVFIAMLWLVPFDTISATVSLPFELKLDRIILPLIVVAWGASLIIGGRDRPRLHWTKVHVAVSAYVVAALVSVLLNLTWLDRQLLLNTSVKALVLLISYATFFVIVASVVRRSEVRAFVNYSLGLAVICGIGALVEYKFYYNPFYQFAHKLLPSSIFTVPVPDARAVDELGRRITLGPAEEPLELSAMASSALPIAMVGLMYASRRKQQILYGLAVCILLAAGLTTFRKSSLILPAIVVLMLAIFRRREIRRLLPLVPVLLVGVHVLAPAAIGGVLQQLTSSELANADTTVSRTTGYESVRPYVWTRPAFGQGYGSYDSSVIYILDSEVLDELITTGVVGLVAYLGMGLVVLIAARPVFRNRVDPVGNSALALGAAAMVFVASSFLYDVMGFPHVPYIFLTFAGLVAVMCGNAEPRETSHRLSGRPA